MAAEVLEEEKKDESEVEISCDAFRRGLPTVASDATNMQKDELFYLLHSPALFFLHSPFLLLNSLQCAICIPCRADA